MNEKGKGRKRKKKPEGPRRGRLEKEVVGLARKGGRGMAGVKDRRGLEAMRRKRVMVLALGEPGTIARAGPRTKEGLSLCCGLVGAVRTDLSGLRLVQYGQ